MADLIDFNEHCPSNSEYITRREYREDMTVLREKIQQLSESHVLTVALVKTISEDLKKVAANTEALNNTYKHWLAVKIVSAYVIGISFAVSVVLFSTDYSGWLRVINRYLNG